MLNTLKVMKQGLKNGQGRDCKKWPRRFENKANKTLKTSKRILIFAVSPQGYCKTGRESPNVQRSLSQQNKTQSH